MSTIFNQFRRPTATVEGEGSQSPSESFRNRYNYMTLANMTELAGGIVTDVIDDAKGISGKVGGEKLSHSDVADLFVSRVMGSVETTRGDL
tara:strand:- start:6886 stop:7158 length:273 start_codon:yes stop_codon:yes gene_type:complete